MINIIYVLIILFIIILLIIMLYNSYIIKETYENKVMSLLSSINFGCKPI